MSPLSRRAFVGTFATLGAAVATGTTLSGTAAAAPATIDRAVGVAPVGSAVNTLGHTPYGWVLVAANGSTRPTTGLDGAELFDLTSSTGGLVAVGSVEDGERDVPTVWESIDGIDWRVATRLTGLDGHLTAVATDGGTALAVGALLTLERAPRQRIVVRGGVDGWSVVPTTGLEFSDEWAATAVAGGAGGWVLSTVDSTGSVLATSPDGLRWTRGSRLVDAAVRSLEPTDAGVRWVANAMSGSGGVTGLDGAARRSMPVRKEARALGTVGDRSYWLAGGRIVSATV